ncbi:hypothetical protein BU16DRAFT_523167 [Lophium mytilinum]|uniref:SPIN90/Ldb17 leucine-rich domain-containing protein n=1 Tax=Lophium mytilinum TaxID=390894 RepID=A0A6A6R7L9_9PEZI|nr:hypothetical protein BU16DRAFT_523167 [Lophium mytilinum]
MAFEGVSYNLENEQQFWDELDEIVSTRCSDHERIDDALRSYLSFTTEFRAEYLSTEDDITKCSRRLIDGDLFANHTDYVRRQIVYCILQEDDNPTLHLVATFLLVDGSNHDATFEMMQAEGAFSRIVELVQRPEVEADMALHQLLLKLLYEMSRIQKLSWDDLVAVDDAFVLRLFQIIEGASYDVDDPYHYPVIRVLLVLNEQYMIASTSSVTISPPPRVTNRVIKALSTHGLSYKTFGENIILLLNRESELSLQLLILKLLFLIFQSSSTAEYFYTNDLHVLIDVILRNLLDLPYDEPRAESLRHTYLRVLHPLLANSQVSRPPHYKRTDILRLLHMLATSGTHFAPIDDTTLRLVKRCITVPWLQETSTPSRSNSYSDAEGGASAPVTPLSGSQENNAIGEGQRELARRMLGMSVKAGNESATSVIEVAAHTARPGIQTPSKVRDAQDA